MLAKWLLRPLCGLEVKGSNPGIFLFFSLLATFWVFEKHFSFFRKTFLVFQNTFFWLGKTFLVFGKHFSSGTTNFFVFLRNFFLKKVFVNFLKPHFLNFLSFLVLNLSLIFTFLVNKKTLFSGIELRTFEKKFFVSTR